MGISFEEYCKRLGNPDFITAAELELHLHARAVCGDKQFGWAPLRLSGGRQRIAGVLSGPQP
jgi:hypothetical protein